MNNKDDIRILTERFFQGETTLSEEQQLYQWYQRDDVPQDLQPYRTLFLDLQAIGPEADKKPVTLVRPLHRRTLRWLIAATLLLAVGLASVLTFHSWQQDECVAYFYGHKTTDRNVVMAEMRLSAETMTVDTEHNDVESLLNEMFNME